MLLRVLKYSITSAGLNSGAWAAILCAASGFSGSFPCFKNVASAQALGPSVVQLQSPRSFHHVEWHATIG